MQSKLWCISRVNPIPLPICLALTIWSGRVFICCALGADCPYLDLKTKPTVRVAYIMCLLRILLCKYNCLCFNFLTNGTIGDALGWCTLLAFVVYNLHPPAKAAKPGSHLVTCENSKPMWISTKWVFSYYRVTLAWILRWFPNADRGTTPHSHSQLPLYPPVLCHNAIPASCSSGDSAKFSNY